MVLSKEQKRELVIAALLGTAFASAYLIAPEQTTKLLRVMKKSLENETAKYTSVEDVEFVTVENDETKHKEVHIRPMKKSILKKILQQL